LDDQLYLRQLEAGVDFAVRDPMAASMDNFVYLLGDRAARECLVVDPAWDIQGLLDAAAHDDMKVVGALVSHWHPDHVGDAHGVMFGRAVEGLAKLMALNPCPVHVHRGDVDYVRQITGISASDIHVVSSGDRVKAGAVEVECLHTPGHTVGSQCFKCGNALVAGDTLFLQGCGRTDLPGGDPEEMRRTLHERLAGLPGDTVLYPGHNYGDRPHAPMSEVRRTNQVFRMTDAAAWRRMSGM